MRRGEDRYIQGYGVKTWGKETLGRPRHRGKDNIEMKLQRMRWKSVFWIDVAQDRDKWRGLVNAVMNLRLP